MCPLFVRFLSASQADILRTKSGPQNRTEQGTACQKKNRGGARRAHAEGGRCGSMKHKITTHASTPGRMEYCTCSRCGQRCGSRVAFGKQECGPSYDERDAQTRMIEHDIGPREIVVDDGNPRKATT